MTEIFQDIKRTYIFAQASEALADCIEFYGETCPEKTRLYLKGECYTIRMFPSWTPTFYINLGTCYQMAVGSHIYHIGKFDDVLISRGSIVERFNQPGDHIFIVKFNPGRLEQVLGVKQASIDQDFIDLRLYLPEKLLNDLKQAATFDERCHIMNNYLEKRYFSVKSVQGHADIVQRATQEYLSNGLAISNAQLAEQFFTTSKTVYRYFKKNIGASPKQYFSGLRARLALSSYAKDPQHFDPYPFGYFDRSHFYKDILNFTGQRITEFC